MVSIEETKSFSIVIKQVVSCKGKENKIRGQLISEV